jgi:hypothetical protein
LCARLVDAFDLVPVVISSERFDVGAVVVRLPMSCIELSPMLVDALLDRSSIVVFCAYEALDSAKPVRPAIKVNDFMISSVAAEAAVEKPTGRTGPGSANFREPDFG